MKKITFTFFTMALLATAFSQAPFTTPVREPRFIKLNAVGNFDEVTTTDEISSKSVAELAVDHIQGTKKNDIDFFKNNGIGINLINNGDGESRYSLSSQVLFYKLYFADPNEQNKDRLNRYNLPMMFISKLSSSYDSISATSALDVLDYEASPVTLRIMPSFKQSFSTFKDVVYWGMYADLRGINLQNPAKNNYSMDVVGSGGIGLTFQGEGAAGTYNTNGEYVDGKYSVSLMFQAATGSKELISQLFKTNKNYVTSFQGFFVFKVSDNSKFNLKLGYQYFFQAMTSGVKSNFSVNIGI